MSTPQSSQPEGEIPSPFRERVLRFIAIYFGVANILALLTIIITTDDQDFEFNLLIVNSINVTAAIIAWILINRRNVGIAGLILLIGPSFAALNSLFKYGLASATTALDLSQVLLFGVLVVPRRWHNRFVIILLSSYVVGLTLKVSFPNLRGVGLDDPMGNPIIALGLYFVTLSIMAVIIMLLLAEYDNYIEALKHIQDVELRIERERADLLANFITSASHEFRTPLAVIAAAMHLSTQPNQDAKSLKKYEQRVSEQIERMTRLLDSLLMISSIDAGAELKLVPTSINELVYQIVHTVNENYKEKHLEISLNLDPDLPDYPLDSHYFQQALVEVIENAFRYTPAGKGITVMTACTPADVTIAVQDEGPGMSAEVLSKAFQRFYREDVAHSKPGLGLGLPIAKAVVTAHRGHIDLVSTPGSGTTCTVVLPMPTKEIVQGHASN